MIRPLPSFLLLLLAACSDGRSRSSPTPTTESNSIDAQVAGDMTAVRLKIAEERIVALERKIGELEANPQKLDLQLLTQRLEQVEARVYARGEVPAAPDPAPSRDRPTPQASPSPVPNRFNPFGL